MKKTRRLRRGSRSSDHLRGLDKKSNPPITPPKNEFEQNGYQFRSNDALIGKSAATAFLGKFVRNLLLGDTVFDKVRFR